MIDSSARIGYLLLDVVGDENNRLNKCRWVLDVFAASPLDALTTAGTNENADLIETATIIDVNNFIAFLFVRRSWDYCVMQLTGVMYDRDNMNKTNKTRET